jgi:hypothetical protein
VSRRVFAVAVAFAVAILFGATGSTVDVQAQGGAAARDTALVPRSPLTPRRAFITSLIAPGLAQSQMARGTGILFATVEALSITMYAKSSRDLAVAKAFASDSAPLIYSVDAATGQPNRDSTGAAIVAEWTTTRYGPGRVRARRTHVEDWVALLIFNHLVAAADAFVAAQLWDLPSRVSLRASPHGATVTARIPW